MTLALFSVLIGALSGVIESAVRDNWWGIGIFWMVGGTVLAAVLVAIDVNERIKISGDDWHYGVIVATIAGALLGGASGHSWGEFFNWIIVVRTISLVFLGAVTGAVVEIMIHHIGKRNISGEIIPMSKFIWVIVIGVIVASIFHVGLETIILITQKMVG